MNFFKELSINECYLRIVRMNANLRYRQAFQETDIRLLSDLVLKFETTVEILLSELNSFSYQKFNSCLNAHLM